MAAESSRAPKFCTSCAAPLLPYADGPHFICSVCKTRHFRNPTVGVAVIVRRDREVLLGRRSRGPYAGLWCIPCGYVEWDEDIRAAAVRECFEETGLWVSLGEVFAVHSNFHDPSRQTVGIWFLGTVLEGQPTAGDDLDLVEYFSLDKPPPLAFPTDELVLRTLAPVGAG